MPRYHRTCCCWHERCCRREAGSAVPGSFRSGKCSSKEVGHWDMHLLQFIFFIRLFHHFHYTVQRSCAISVLSINSLFWVYFKTCSVVILNTVLYEFVHAWTQEEGVHQVFTDHKFYYPVKVTIEQTSPLEDFPWIRPNDFIKALHKTNDLPHLLGGYTLKEAKPVLADFWAKYKAAFPEHQLWDHVASTGKDITKCIPIFLHGDEGTSFKRGGILMVSIQGAIGTGTSKSKRIKLEEQNLRAMGEGIPLNFLRTGLQTRLLVCSCPKDGNFILKNIPSIDMWFGFLNSLVSRIWFWSRPF